MVAAGVALAAGGRQEPTSAGGMLAPRLTGNITVVDGDTVKRGTEVWRVQGLDAPEIHGARCEAERSLAIRAAARLIDLLETRGGRLVGEGREKYGRRLGRLMLGWPSTGEEDWAEVAVREGLAVAWDGKGRRHDWCR